MVTYDVLTHTAVAEDDQYIIDLNDLATQGWRVVSTWTVDVIDEGRTKKDDEESTVVYTLLVKDSGVIEMGPAETERVG